MSKTLRILCLIFALTATACGAEQSEVTVSMVGTSSTTTTVVDLPPPISQTTTSTTSAPSTTTTMRPTTTTQARVKAQSAPRSGSVWDTISLCESGGNWHLNAKYDGGLQISEYNWTVYVAAGKSYGLSGYPAYAYQATREQQITIAVRIRDGVKNSRDPYLNAQGYGAWPECRHKAGV